MIIDAHIHITTNGKWFNTDFDASVITAIKQMDNAKIDKAIVLNMTVLNDNLALARQLSNYDDRFFLFACLDFMHMDASNQLEELVKEYGFAGLKIHPRIQAIDPLNELLFPIYDKAIELNIPIVFDCFLQSNTIALEKLHPYVYDKIAKKYPKLKIVIAHCGWPRIWDTYHVVKSNENVYLDISYILTKFSKTSLINDLSFMLEHLDQKVLYGSDFPENRIDNYIKEFINMSRHLTQDKIDNICCNNITRILE